MQKTDQGASRLRFLRHLQRPPGVENQNQIQKSVKILSRASEADYPLAENFFIFYFLLSTHYSLLSTLYFLLLT